MQHETITVHKSPVWSLYSGNPFDTNEIKRVVFAAIFFANVLTYKINNTG